MIAAIASLFSKKYPYVLTYMLQVSEYNPTDYLKWFWRTQRFDRVVQRQNLDKTKAARIFYLAILACGLGVLTVGIVMAAVGFKNGSLALIMAGAGTVLVYPFIVAHLIVLPLVAARILILKPRQNKAIALSRQIFKDHPATRIAVAGSYGKTSMKEMLATILSEGKEVAATPGNKNVALSHANFAAKLSGKEEVLIIEYGEGAPGDVKRFAETTQPHLAVITGVAPAHLHNYKTLEAAANDIFSVAAAVGPAQTYVNAESPACYQYLSKEMHLYSRQGVDNWKVGDVRIGYQGMELQLARNSAGPLKLKTALVGRHLIGPLTAAVAIASSLGLSDEQIKAGVAKTAPYEHRLQPYQLGGAWVIDDTYNGTLEGLKAGLSLLAELPAKRKIYVTPGLVEQGDQAENVHRELGQVIVGAGPDAVVLMKNTTTDWVTQALEGAGYKGEVRIEENPLYFYENLSHFVATGDLVLMQNDWTDNYH